MKSLSKITYNTLQFVGIGIPIYCVVLLISGNYLHTFIPSLDTRHRNSSHLWKRITEADTVSGVDILALGSSHCHRGFNPELFEAFGYRLFNYGSGSQTYLHSEYFLHRNIEQLKPKLVLLECYVEMYANDGTEGGLEIITNLPSIDRSFLKQAIPHLNIPLFNALLYRLLSDCFGNNNNRLRPNTPEDEQYIKGGYVKLIQRRTKRTVHLPNHQLTIHPSQQKALYRMVSYLRKHAIPMVLVHAPISTEKLNSYTNYSEFMYNMKAECARLNVPLLDYNSLIPELTHPDNFYDSHHLQPDAVDIFNYDLITRLGQMSFLFLDTAHTQH